MQSIPETDQWKLDGKCYKCRRRTYCSKACSKNKAVTQRLVREALRLRMGGMSPDSIVEQLESREYVGK